MGRLSFEGTYLSAQNKPPSLLTMTSREIADLTGKRHDHVKRDIEVMLSELSEDIPKFGGIYSDSMNRQQTEYLLPKGLTITLVSGYSIAKRHRIVTRWMELEASGWQPVGPDKAPARPQQGPISPPWAHLQNSGWEWGQIAPRWWCYRRHGCLLSDVTSRTTGVSKRFSPGKACRYWIPQC